MPLQSAPLNRLRIGSPTFDPINFSNSTQIDNQWYPLIPGTQFIYEGSAVRGSGLRPHRVVFTVTDLTKVINGVRTVVMWDRDFNNGKLVEAELAFHAQDNAGNVLESGEYPEEYERGKFVGAASTWIAGVESTASKDSHTRYTTHASGHAATLKGGRPTSCSPIARGCSRLIKRSASPSTATRTFW